MACCIFVSFSLIAIRLKEHTLIVQVLALGLSSGICLPSTYKLTHPWILERLFSWPHSCLCGRWLSESAQDTSAMYMIIKAGKNDIYWIQFSLSTNHNFRRYELHSIQVSFRQDYYIWPKKDLEVFVKSELAIINIFAFIISALW